MCRSLPAAAWPPSWTETGDTRFDVNDQPIPINAFLGGPHDGESRIWPFERMHTWQPFDTGHGTLVYTHLWGDDDAAYWGNYDMAKAIGGGMTELGLDYSGELGFLEIVSYWPITHMVAPKEDALACDACHSRDARLAELKGVYMPGRDRNRWLDLAGLFVVFGTLGGTLGHGLVRRMTRKNDGGAH